MIRTKLNVSYLSLTAASISLFLILACSEKTEIGQEKLEMGERNEIIHQGKGHEVHISPPSVAVSADGSVLVAWFANKGETTNLYLANPSGEQKEPVRVNPEGMSVDGMHQSPGIAVGPEGEIYVSWSSTKPKPEGVLFASDLRLSRSLDGGKSFDTHLRVNRDLPISHSFEGVAVGPDGTVFVSWIDSREGQEKAGTYLAQIAERGTEVQRRVKLDDSTCVCCRVDVATDTNKNVAVLWRKVFTRYFCEARGRILRRLA